MEIQLLSPPFVRATAQLYQASFAEAPWNESWQLDAALEVINNPLLTWWIMTEGTEVLGFVAGGICSRGELATSFKIPEHCVPGTQVMYLAELGVSAQHRRQGIARNLTSTLLAYARAESADSLVVRTKPGTGNYPWYMGKLTLLHTYDDGRTVFGAARIPQL